MHRCVHLPDWDSCRVRSEFVIGPKNNIYSVSIYHLPSIPSFLRYHVLRLDTREVCQVVRIYPELLAFTGHYAEADQPVEPVVGTGAGFQSKVGEELNIILSHGVLRWLFRVGFDLLRVLGSWARAVQAVGANVDVVAITCACSIAGVKSHGLLELAMSSLELIALVIIHEFPLPHSPSLRHQEVR